MVRIGWQVNMLLLVSKKCFLTSQGLVGAGMNCRALTNYGNHNNQDTNNKQTYQIRTTTEDRHKPVNYHPKIYIHVQHVSNMTTLKDGNRAESKQGINHIGNITTNDRHNWQEISQRLINIVRLGKRSVRD